MSNASNPSAAYSPSAIDARSRSSAAPPRSMSATCHKPVSMRGISRPGASTVRGGRVGESAMSESWHMSSPAMLTTRQLVRAFGSLRAVDGVDLQVRANTITGLIGPNGAGKTPVFNLIAGALAPSAGDIRFRGEPISGLSPDRIFRKGVARTFQVPRPFPQMTVLENLMLVPLEQAGESFWNNWWRGAPAHGGGGAARGGATGGLARCVSA